MPLVALIIQPRVSLSSCVWESMMFVDRDVPVTTVCSEFRIVCYPWLARLKLRNVLG